MLVLLLGPLSVLALMLMLFILSSISSFDAMDDDDDEFVPEFVVACDNERATTRHAIHSSVFD